MIERVRIRNFQRHRRLDLELDPAVTTIVGPNDRGKSAALRAIRWALQNRPRGDAFVRSGSGECRVEVVAEGRTLVRRKGRGGNSYELDGRRLSAFGAGVPDEVAAFANVDDLNFQRQVDPPFWLTESPGEVSRRLNQVVDLELVDSSLARASAELRAAEAEEAAARASLVEARRTRRELAPSVVQVEADLRRVDAAAAEWTQAALEHGTMVSDLDEARTASATARALRRLPDALADLGRLEARAKRLERSTASAAALREAVDEARVARRRASDARLEEKAAAADLAAALDGRCPLCLRSGAE